MQVNQAGPEFDAIVAKALGWRLVFHDKEKGRILGGLPPSAKEDDCFIPIPEFSTKMGPAWAIVTRKLKRFELTQLGEGDGNEAIVAATAPLAICLCYLRLIKYPFKTTQRSNGAGSHSPSPLESLVSSICGG